MNPNAFSPEDISRLTSHAQEHYAPSSEDEEMHHLIQKHYERKQSKQHQLNVKLGNANSSMAFDNPRESKSEVNTAGFPPSPPKGVRKKTSSKPPPMPDLKSALRPADKTVTPQRLEGDSWRSSPEAQSGSGSETGETTGLP